MAASLTVVDCKREGERMDMEAERWTDDTIMAELCLETVHAVAVGTANERRAAVAAEIFILLLLLLQLRMRRCIRIKYHQYYLQVQYIKCVLLA